jgi:hypothetical protein
VKEHKQLKSHNTLPNQKTAVMKNPTTISFLKYMLLAAGILLVSGVFAQVKYSSKNNAGLTISGTSTLHDWDMKSAQGACEAVITTTPAGAITALSGLSFSTQAESLKSGKGAMDKNAYKALKSDKFATITYVAHTASVSLISGNDYLVKTNGKLTIAGATVDAEVQGTCKVNADKTISVMGSKKISMKDFGMVPPSFMLGTIKTGNDVTLKFDITLTK